MSSTTSQGGAAAPSPVTSWEIDPVHSTAQFKVRHMMISNVKGEFTAIRGSVQIDSADVTRSSAEGSIDAASINTRDAQRDGHLRSPDFLDAEKYPTLAFRSTRISRGSDGTLEASGELTIHGITRPIVFAVEGPTPETRDPWGNTRIGLAAEATIDRKDFGLTWNSALETGGVLVGDKVAITVDLELVKK